MGKQDNSEDKACLDKARGWYVQDFIGYIAIEKSLAPRTVSEYEDDLRIFFEYFQPYLDDGLTLSSMDSRTIREFLAYLKLKKNYTPNGLNRKIACLKSYFKFLKQEQYIDDSPMENVESAKNGKHLPKVLSRSDVEQILARARARIAESKGKWNCVRDLAILELFYASGMRLAELVGINLSDVDLEELTIKVLGKGNKERYVFINESAAKAIANYLACRPKIKNPALFLNRFYGRLSRRAVEIVFDTIKGEAGILKEASPHTLRHSFATHMLEGGSDLVTIKELMGHASLSTTQVYTNISRRHMREVYEQSHPRK